jgi:hypothetical protein
MEMVTVTQEVLKVYVGIVNVSLDMVHVVYGKIKLKKEVNVPRCMVKSLWT